ncbi:N-acetyltransferase family protein [Niallia taxi]|uniref:GNAT family N-acetyltransferase n=1 Tax=Niallia taxi TaxID=2499688 RepID=UPI003D2C1DDF
MEIKVLEKKDADVYIKLRLEALKLSPEAFASSYEEEKEFTIETFENRLSNSSSYTLGAFENGELLGVVTLQLEQKAKLKHRINIFAMYVAVGNRGHGVGKKLLKEAITRSKQMNGIEAIYLTVGAANQPAKNLYKSLGFATYGIDKKALKIDNTYFDEELMVLYF